MERLLTEFPIFHLLFGFERKFTIDTIINTLVVLLTLYTAREAHKAAIEARSAAASSERLFRNSSIPYVLLIDVKALDVGFTSFKATCKNIGQTPAFGGFVTYALFSWHRSKIEDSEKPVATLSVEPNRVLANDESSETLLQIPNNCTDQKYKVQCLCYYSSVLDPERDNATGYSVLTEVTIDRSTGTVEIHGPRITRTVAESTALGTFGRVTKIREEQTIRT